MNPSVHRVLAWLLPLGLAVASAPSGVAAADPVALVESHGGTVRLVHRDDAGLDVDLGGSAVTDDDLAELALLKNLRVLRLKECRIGDAGLAHVARITTLERLSLDGTDVTDAGMPQLATLTGLEFLNLYGTAIGDDGLADVARLPALKTVVVTATRVTPRGVSALRDSKPALQVIPDPFRQRERNAAALQVATAAVAEAERELAEARPLAAAAVPTIPGLKAAHAEAQRLSGAARKHHAEEVGRVKEAGITAENASNFVADLRERAAGAPADAPIRRQLEEQSRLADEAAGEVARLRQRADEAFAAVKAAGADEKKRFLLFRNAEAVANSADEAQERLDASRRAAEYIRGEAATADQVLKRE